nr:reverse transcriptase domain-containing protein [Tanacetum cinerariifolium]
DWRLLSRGFGVQSNMGCWGKGLALFRGNSATQQWELFYTNYDKYSSSRIFITGSDNALENFIPNRLILRTSTQKEKVFQMFRAYPLLRFFVRYLESYRAPLTIKTPIDNMADTRTMSELLQAPTEGYEDAIVLPPILDENFELKVRFDETFSEAWDRFKDLLRKCPHHATDGYLLNRTHRDALTIIENKSKVRTSRNKPVVSKSSATISSSTLAYLPKITALTDVVKAMLLQNKTPSPAPVKAIEEICVTYGGSHPYYECLATDSNTFNASTTTWTYNQGGLDYHPQGETNYHASNQMRPPGFLQSNKQNNQNQYNQNQGYNQNRGSNFNQGNQNYQAPLNQTQVGPSNDFLNYMKTNDVYMRAMKNQISSGSLPSNTIANPRGDLKVITTRSGISYDGPTIPPTSFPLLKEVKREPVATKDKVQTTSSGTTIHVQPLVVQIPIPEPDVAPKPNPKPLIPYPSRLNDQQIREKSNNQMLKFLKNFQRLHFDLSFADALFYMPKPTSIYSYRYDDESVNRIDVIDVTCEEYAQEVLGFLDSSKKEIEACLTSDSIPSRIDDANFDPKGDILLLDKLLNDDPSSFLPPKGPYFEELKTIKSFIGDPLELELKELLSHLEYAFLEGTNKLTVIIAKELKDEEKAALLKVQKSHKLSITWKISDIKC